jgi:hypothetical protein
MVGRWLVPKMAAAGANSGVEARLVSVVARWQAWVMSVARTWRTAPMRPGMGWGVGCVGVVGGMGLFVAGMWERSEINMIIFL